MILVVFTTIYDAMSFFKHPTSAQNDQEIIIDRQNQLLENWKEIQCPHLFSLNTEFSKANKCNCENMIGQINLPVGLAGPVRIIEVSGEPEDFFVPLATSEGALVASVGRGLKAINKAGGARIFVKNVGMTRAPVFSFMNGAEAFAFANYLDQKDTLAEIKKITEVTSNHLKFQKLQSFVRGRKVYVRFSFLTDEAMGMNMVTIALQKLWEEFLSKYEGIQMLALSSNVCTDKKTSYINQLFGRGYSVQAEVFLSEDILRETLKTTSKDLMKTHLAKNLIGSNLAGSPATNMQFANVAVAFYLATGQDAAHVTEASLGSTFVEEDEQANGVYFAVSLPDLPLGSIGGGTNLPAQKELKSILSKTKEVLSSKQLVSILAAGVLAAEISGLAALSNHTLAAAHNKLARGKHEK